MSREVYEAAYARFPHLPEDQRVRWAERVSHSIPLQVAYSLTGPLLYGKYEPADYTDDTASKKGPK